MEQLVRQAAQAAASVPKKKLRDLSRSRRFFYLSIKDLIRLRIDVTTYHLATCTHLDYFEFVLKSAVTFARKPSERCRNYMDKEIFQKLTDVIRYLRLTPSLRRKNHLFRYTVGTSVQLHQAREKYFDKSAILPYIGGAHKAGRINTHHYQVQLGETTRRFLQ